MTVDVRTARADDVEALVAIENEAFDSDRLSRRSLRRLVASPSAAVIVAADRGIVGYCAVLFRRGSRVARLYSLAVRPNVARRGIGRLLLAAAEAETARRGRTALRLEVRDTNARALGLYEKSGYRGLGRLESYYADGAAALRCEKPLAPTRTASPSRPGTAFP